MESAQHREGNRQRVRTEGRWYYPHWVRSVAAEPHERYAGRQWTMWQYTTAGRVSGIEDDVERNAFYGSSAEWAKFLATDRDPRHTHRFAAQR